MVRIQISLTDKEAKALKQYGAVLGYTLPKTIRFIIGKTAERILIDTNIPDILTFTLPYTLEKRGIKALKEYEKGETIKVEPSKIDKFFDSI